MANLESHDCKPGFPWGPWVAFYSAITFLMLGIDMALLHLGFRHYNVMAIMPIVFCGVAALVSAATVFSRWLRVNAWVLGTMALLVGSIGTVIHLEIAFSGLKVFSFGLLLERLVFDPRPPLAPAALAGTGLLLYFIAFAERWPAVVARFPLLARLPFRSENIANPAVNARAGSKQQTRI